MSKDLQIRVVGYPDFWSQAQQVCPDFFDKTTKLIPHLKHCFDANDSEPLLARTVGSVAKMVCDSLNAVVILVANGHGLDALRITRCMYEGAVTAEYLVKFPDELRDYLDYTKISAKKLQDYKDKYPRAGMDATSPERKEKIEADYQSIVGRYTYPDSKKVRDRWSKKSIKHIFADLGVEALYESFYHLASSAIHMNARGMYMGHQLNDEGQIINYRPPNPEWLQISAVTACSSVRIALTAYKATICNEKKRELLQVSIDEFSIESAK